MACFLPCHSCCAHRSAGRVLGDALAASSNANAVGEKAARDALCEAIRGAMGRGGAVRALCACMSGVDSASDIARVHGWLEEDMPELKERGVAVHVNNDAVAALAAGTAGVLAGAAVLIAGTGTIALGYGLDDPDAGEPQRSRAAGWGPALGDGGSGHDLGARALRAVCRAADGRGKATALSAAILGHLGLAAERELIGWVYGREGWAHVAELAPLVMQAAAAGDQVAAEICDAAAAELCESVCAVASKLRLGQVEHAFPLVMAGGVLSQGSEIATRLVARVTEALPAAQPTWADCSPAVGAAMLARRMAEQSQGDHAEGEGCL